MALRQIRMFDDEILRKASRPVARVDSRIREILTDMADTLHNTPNASGLAACQVGILKRLVVIDMKEGLIQLVNPEIVAREGEELVTEGCLSFPGTWGKTLRPQRVTVRALDERGEEVTIEGTGPLAKCLCHEIDHLDGIVFTDRIVEYI